MPLNDEVSIPLSSLHGLQHEKEKEQEQEVIDQGFHTAKQSSRSAT